MIKKNTACLTGHRPKNLPWGYDETNIICLKFKENLKQIFIKAINYGLTTFLTGMAEGFDMIATEVLFELRKTYNIKIIAIIPCLGQEKLWSIKQQKRYNKIKKQCNDFIVLKDEYTQDCMLERNKYMVDHSSVCIAYWNGSPGGTGLTVRYAKENGCKVKIINAKSFD